MLSGSSSTACPASAASSSASSSAAPSNSAATTYAPHRARASRWSQHPCVTLPAAAPAAPSAPSSSAPTAAATAAELWGHVTVSDESKGVGCLLGAMCGNVLGAPHQDDRHYQVVRMRASGVTDFWRYDTRPQPLQYGQYTGDFGNLLAVTRSLLATRGVDTASVLQSLVDSYSPETRRYSPYDKLVAEAVLAGAAAEAVPELAERYLAEVTRRHAGTSSDRAEREPYGPSDFCAAARAAPIGFAYRHAGHARLLPAVRRSLTFSHPTPMALDAAAVVAAAAGWCGRQQPGDGVVCSPEALLSHLINDVAVTADMLAKLRLLRDNLFQLEAVTSWRALYGGPQWHALTRMLSTLSFHGYATPGSEFVAVALLALLSSWGRPEQAVVVAASFGGHAPATAQVVGALAGALYGRDWVPERWWAGLENGEDEAEGEGEEQAAAEGREGDGEGQKEGEGGEEGEVESVGWGGRDEVVELGRLLGTMRLAEMEREGEEAR